MVGSAEPTNGVGRKRSHRKGVTQMKLVATILVAVFVMAASMSFAFADCAGHTKAQMVQSNDPQISSDRVATTDALPTVPEKVAQSVKTGKAVEKK
jgi:hypothetical protein